MNDQIQIMLDKAAITKPERDAVVALMHQLAHAQETSDGWMQAYYRQTNRLLRVEGALRDLANATPEQQPWAQSRAHAILNEQEEQ